jgi:hypothetical protein
VAIGGPVGVDMKAIKARKDAVAGGVECAHTVMQRAMHIHPTVSEFTSKMMGELKPLQ